MGCLYKLTSPSGKVYIGVTLKDFVKRWKQHIKDSKRGSNNPLYLAMRKYGPDQFLKEVLAYSDNPQVLLAFESRAAIAFKALKPNGYNLFAGGACHFIISEESRSKQSKSAKRRFSDPLERKAQSERTKRKWEEPAFRADMGDLRKRVGSTESFKQKARAHMASQRQDPEFVKVLAAAQSKRMKNLWSDPAYRQSQLASFHSESARKKASVSLKEHWASNPKRGTRNGQKNSPEQNAAIGRANKIAYSDPARRSMLASRTKAQWADPIKRAKRLEAIKDAWARKKAKHPK